MTTDEKISKIRKIMKQKGFDAWIINGTDPHCSEYVCPRWQSRKYVTSFTGSAGQVIITEDFAGIWVDSRYFIQCSEQIKGTCLKMMRLDGPGSSSPLTFLSAPDKRLLRTGLASETVTPGTLRKYREKDVNIIPCDDDILDEIWADRPAVPKTDIYRIPDEACGLSASDKIMKIREKCIENGECWTIISNLDEIAWILNLRASDIEYSPVFISYLLIGMKSCILFTDKSRFSNVSQIPQCIRLSDYESIHSVLKTITPESGKVHIDPDRTNMRIISDLSHALTSEGPDYAIIMKACKSKAEISGMEKAHIMDGIALVSLFARIKSGKYSFTELSLSESLEQIKRKIPGYIGPSFSTIAGFGAHGAIVHYSADCNTDVPLCGDNLLVLDCGSQYSFGTTDVTRTLLFGSASEKQKHDYTIVLKGHLALSRQIFPEGTTGAHLDVLAKQFLWQNCLTYYHGTGHGVGFCLNVHEGPQSISPRSFNVPLKEGMITSDEPGLYIENLHGIRIENLVITAVQEENEFGRFLFFKTLTCCPYERELIDTGMLTEEERNQINKYNKWVRDSLFNLVDSDTQKYLIQATEAI